MFGFIKAIVVALTKLSIVIKTSDWVIKKSSEEIKVNVANKMMMLISTAIFVSQIKGSLFSLR